MKRSVVILRNTPNWGQGIVGLTGYELCIQLTRGYLALIDADDLVALSSVSWFVQVMKHRIYAARRSPVDEQGKQQQIYMHRQLMEPTDDQEVDHMDQHRLFDYKVVDNRRSNLRNVTTSQNQANQRKQVGCSSKYKGVAWYKRDEKWIAMIRTNGRPTNIGRFEIELEAALAYDQAHEINWPGIQEGLNRTLYPNDF